MAKKNKRNSQRKSRTVSAQIEPDITRPESHSSTSVHNISTASHGRTQSFESSVKQSRESNTTVHNDDRIDNSQGKQDPVLSSSAGDPITNIGTRIHSARRRRQWYLKLRSWWPCRTYRLLRELIAALSNIRWNDQQRFRDLVLVLGLFIVSFLTGYIVIEFALGLIKGVSAQDMDTNCSIVYVTVTGPIITVSLIDVPPTDPAHGTCFFLSGERFYRIAQWDCSAQSFRYLAHQDGKYYTSFYFAKYEYAVSFEVIC